ncbi:Cytochrome c heme lyase subunit CcmL [Candidatus Burkholderia humilis]|nr:Cytochrome c heme lyase subunit CcmL [Candidatus Burkholderia humilis]
MSKSSIAKSIAVCALLLVTTHAAAQSAEDAHIRELTEGFRCVVCQNQSLADSNAPLAADLRARIREQVERGASDDDIRTDMVRRYGDFVLYRPPMKAATLALWFDPLAALVLGGVALASCVRRAQRKDTRA